MPPLKNEPLTEAVKKVVLHQADGYSPLTSLMLGTHLKGKNPPSVNQALLTIPNLGVVVNEERAFILKSRLAGDFLGGEAFCVSDWQCWKCDC